jgi:Bacterial PH domain
MLCGLPIFVLFLVLGSPWRYVAASVAVVPTAWAVRRAFRISLVVTEDRVTVRNYWRTHTFPWSEVKGVGVALKQQGVLPQPALAFELQSGAVFAQATPFRKSERQEFQAAVLALAPSAVVPLRDTAGPIGADHALSNKLRLWWLRNQPPRVALKARAHEQVWLEQPFPFSLFFASSGLVASGFALVLGISVLAGAFIDNAGVWRYLLAILLSVAGAVGCLVLALILKGGQRPPQD